MMRLAVTVLLGALAGATPVVHAAEGEPPCLADIERLCRLVPGTGAFIQGCLELQWDDLSSECRKHVGATTDDGVRIGDACESDMDRLCSDVDPGGGQRTACLLRNRDALSTRCRDTLDAMVPKDDLMPRDAMVPPMEAEAKGEGEPKAGWEPKAAGELKAEGERKGEGERKAEAAPKAEAEDE
jgi:hypothetical protein